MEVRFDETEDIAEAMRERASSTKQGFDPLPKVPPFHFNDNSTLKPIYDT